MQGFQISDFVIRSLYQPAAHIYDAVRGSCTLKDEFGFFMAMQMLWGPNLQLKAFKSMPNTQQHKQITEIFRNLARVQP